MLFWTPETTARAAGFPLLALGRNRALTVLTAAGLAFSGFWFAENLPAAEAEKADQADKAEARPPKTARSENAAASSKADRPKGVGDARISLESEPAKPDLSLSHEEDRSAEALAHFVTGLMAEDDGDSDEALAAYEKVLALDATQVDPKLAVRVASEYVRRGNVAEGISLLKDAIKAQPGEPLPYVTVAYLYLRQLQKPELALKFARQAVEVAPYDLRGYQVLWIVLDSQGQNAESEKVIDQAASVESGDAEYWFGVADLYLRMYARDTGEDQMLPSRMDKVTAIFEKALAKDPNNPGVLSRVADFYYKSGRVKTAVPLYLKAIAQDSGASDALQADVREKLAQTYYGMGKRQEAIEMVQALIKLNPSKPEAYTFLAQMEEQANDLPQALAHYRQALILSPSDLQAYIRVARLALALKQPQVAIDTLIDARGRFAHPEVTTLLAIAYTEANRLPEAMAKFEEAITESNSFDDSTLNPNFYLSYAEATQKAGLVDKTVALIRKSIELDPQEAHRGQNFLGYYWVDRGENLEEGAQLIRLALMKEPDNGAYLDSLGWYYYRKGNYDLALKQLLKAVENIPEEDAVIFEHVGDTYEKLGQTAKAQDYWKKALRLDPANKSIAGKLDAQQEKVTANPAPEPVR